MAGGLVKGSKEDPLRLRQWATGGNFARRVHCVPTRCRTPDTPITTTTSREHKKKCTNPQFAFVIISSGGLPICPHPMKLVYTHSRVRLEMRSRYFRWYEHFVSCAEASPKTMTLEPQRLVKQMGVREKQFS